MCGIAGAVSLNGQPITGLDRKLSAMSQLIEHRGPDGHGSWSNDNQSVGLVHRRLAIIDLTPDGAQPMAGPMQKPTTMPSSMAINTRAHNLRSAKRCR